MTKGIIYKCNLLDHKKLISDCLREIKCKDLSERAKKETNERDLSILFIKLVVYSQKLGRKDIINKLKEQKLIISHTWLKE